MAVTMKGVKRGFILGRCYSARVEQVEEREPNLAVLRLGYCIICF